MNRPPRYWPFYCEENVWLACEHAPPGARVAFISNPQRAVALCYQRAAGDGIGPVLWDYHVILLEPGGEEEAAWVVIDLDTTLGERVPAAEYLDRTFMANERLPAQLRPQFRVLDAADYRARLSSDREHMRRPDGGYSAKPPPWPTIGSGEPNLMRFVDVERSFVGEVLSLHEMRARFCEAGSRGPE